MSWGLFLPVPDPHTESYKNEKTENYNSDEGERKKKKEREISSVMRRFLASRKKTLDC